MDGGVPRRRGRMNSPPIRMTAEPRTDTPSHRFLATLMRDLAYRPKAKPKPKAKAASGSQKSTFLAGTKEVVVESCIILCSSTVYLVAALGDMGKEVP